MDLVTKNYILSTVIQRQKRQYPTNQKLFGDGRFAFDIIKALEDKTPLTEEVAIKIIGNDSWTRNECDECSKDVQEVVQIGVKDHSDGAQLCLECLSKAVDLINNHKNLTNKHESKKNNL